MRFMKKLLFTFLWVLCFLTVLVVGDQFLLRFPADDIVLLSDFQHFYRDFRQRLVHTLPAGRHKDTLAPALPVAQRATDKRAVVGQVRLVAQQKRRQAVADEPHYIYLDGNKAISFATTLDEIPANLRHSAKKLDN